MHGRPRPPKDLQLSTEARQAQERKTAVLKSATAEVLRRRRNKQYDSESLALAANYLTLNPEVYTVWNYRREAILLPLESSDTEPERKKAIVDGELNLVGQSLKRNPKSYAAWHHRRWVVQRGPCDIQDEFRFVEKLLDEDARNFHAWGYRQFLLSLPGRPTASAEVDYTQCKIEQNFSNFSAWHHRTKVLPELHGEVRTIGLQELLEESQASKSEATDGKLGNEAGSKRPNPLSPAQLDEEYDMCHSAFSTDVEDSSAWFYYRWLLGNSLSSANMAKGTEKEAGSLEDLRRVLVREISRMQQEHLDTTTESKWPLLALARLKEAKIHTLGEDTDGTLAREVKEAYQKLISIDHRRKGYYEDAKEGKALVVLMSLGAQATK